MATYSLALLPTCAVVLIAARAPQKPEGELVLDAGHPVIAAEIEGVPLRLRVDLDQQDSIELNPAAAARLPVTWNEGYAMDVGRVRLGSRGAAVRLRVEGRTMPGHVSEHGRECCSDTDGAIGPDLLPFATVRWRNAKAPLPNASLLLPLVASPNTGLSAATDIADVRLRFALRQPESVGTAAAGAELSRLWGGSWRGPASHVALAFGIERPARTIAFTRAGTLAGFRFDHLLVRISDFAGDKKLPPSAGHASDVVVSHGLPRQRAWPAVTIGADRLSRCAEIVYNAVPRSLTLHCAFDSP